MAKHDAPAVTKLTYGDGVVVTVADDKVAERIAGGQFKAVTKRAAATASDATPQPAKKAAAKKTAAKKTTAKKAAKATEAAASKPDASDASS